MLTFDYFIKNGYEKDCSQWIAYSLNEITKYNNDPKLYTLALKNFQDNVERLHNSSIAPTSFELVNCVYETYQRLLSNNIKLDYAEKNFKLDELTETIEYRLQRLLDNYFFPEYAMYMKSPSRILNTFYVRQESFRTRIDDVQHSVGGLYIYYNNFDY